MITHEFMLGLTENMPMKRIRIHQRPYMDRYYAGELEDGTELWLHHYHCGDQERGLHNHPWHSRSIVVRGGYSVTELDGNELRDRHRSPPIIMSDYSAKELLNGSKVTLDSIDRYGGVDRIGPLTWHRIERVDPNTWTIMLIETGRRLPFWFKEADGGYDTIEASDPNWWMECGTRRALYDEAG